MFRSMADIQSATAEIRRAKKKKERRKKPKVKNIMACPINREAIIKLCEVNI